MSITIFGLKNCDTCRKALKSCPSATLVDVRADGISDEFLGAALAQFGEILVNKRSTTWRNLDETARQSDPLALLRAHPSLMKRPLIEAEGKLYLGWTKETQAGLGVG